MSDLATQKPNRSVRRQLTREQSKRERKEEKKLMKNAPDSVRFNSKKSRKVVPYNPIKAALVEKDTTPKKKDALENKFVPAVITDKVPATMVIAAAAKIPEEDSEVNASQEDERKELPKEQKEEGYTQQHQEPPLPLPEEGALKEIYHESTTNEEDHNASSSKAAQDSVSISDKTENIAINQSDMEKDHRHETENEAIATAMNAPSSDEDPIDKYDEAESDSNLVTITTTTTTTTTTTRTTAAAANDETNVADTNRETKEGIQQIQHQQEPKKTEEEEETTLQKDTTPAPSMTTSASISDKISPSTSTSSNKRKSTLISRLFKHKNSSKEDKNVAHESPLVSNKNASSDKKKKPKAWKIWKKL
ncbi:hypothetical protein MAM1_0374d10144 [Mucor ambiguus]|uniref:Uncharacterized protein n=1 Tax=Mucor ambiguus TaxID=91626 RepID=A0A0C9LY17_9FUNG|nr:hypothetical protein MAM1_0374d10144 [Mucor ambiguus]